MRHLAPLFSHLLTSTEVRQCLNPKRPASQDTEHREERFTEKIWRNKEKLSGPDRDFIPSIAKVVARL